MDIEDIFQKVRLNESDAYDYLDDLRIANLVNLEQQSLLQEAIAYKNSDVIEKLIGMDLDFNHQDKLGRSALHSTVTHDDLETATKLIRKGINVNLLDKHSNEALWTAVLKPKLNYELISLFVKAGANVNHENNYGRSPVVMAKTKNNEKLLQILESTQ